MNRKSLIDWAVSWVADDPPGQKQRFREALSDELSMYVESPGLTDSFNAAMNEINNRE